MVKGFRFQEERKRTQVDKIVTFHRHIPKGSKAPKHIEILGNIPNHHDIVIHIQILMAFQLCGYALEMLTYPG